MARIARPAAAGAPALSHTVQASNTGGASGGEAPGTAVQAERVVEGGQGRATRRGLALTRRRVLQGPPLAVAGAALPALAVSTPAAASAADPNMPDPGEKTAADYPVGERMRRLSGYIAGARSRPLPAEVVERAKWNVLDTLAAIVSGSQLVPGRGALKYVHAYAGGRPVATVITDRILCGPADAALANGIMAHSDETDDTVVVATATWHPGVAVVPAALALGEQLKISGEHFLRSVVVGYDVGTRVLDASGVSLNYKVPTFSLAGYFGAAAAAASVCGFNEAQTRWILSYIAQHSGGLDSFRRDPEHMEKAYSNAGMVAQAGVQTALLIMAGFNGVNDVFSSQANFFQAYEATAKPEKLVADLGQRFSIMDSDFKRWPAGGPTQQILDALQFLLRQRPIDHTQIREIVIRHNAEFITDNSGPLAINAQHVTALMLVDGKVSFRNVHDPARARDPRVIRLRSITRQVPGPSPWAPVTEEMRRTPVIQITLADGTKLSQMALPGARGSRENPVTREWVVQKARTLMEPVLGAAKTDGLIDRVLHLEGAKTILELRPLLQANLPPGPPRLSEWPVGGAR